MEKQLENPRRCHGKAVFEADFAASTGLEPLREQLDGAECGPASEQRGVQGAQSSLLGTAAAAAVRGLQRDPKYSF